MIRPRAKYTVIFAYYKKNCETVFSMNHAEQCDNEMQNVIE